MNCVLSRYVVIIMCAMGTVRCATQTIVTINSDVEAQVLAYNPADLQPRDLGKTPLRLVNPTSPLGVTLVAPGFPSKDLYILDASSIDSEVKVSFGNPAPADAARTIDLASEDYQFMEGILKVHRLLLLGEITEARKLLDATEQQTQLSNAASAKMRANLELFSGNPNKARKIYRRFTPTPPMTP